MTINKGDFVLIRYNITSDSNPYESGVGKLKVGDNTLFPSIENSLLGMSLNDTKVVKLREEFGSYNQSLVVTIPSSQIPEAIKVGDFVHDSNNRKSKIIYRDSNIVVLDYNNPLSGKNVLFEIQVLDVQKISYDNILVFDIGYNNGNFSKEILLTNPNSKIVAIDAHPMYEQRFNENPISNITFINNAISDKLNEEISFFICDSNPGINSINENWISEIRHSHFFDKTKREIKVKSITLDYLIENYGIPDILKLDIEGAEFLALSGLSKKCPLVLFEWCEECFEDTKKCLHLLKDLGYTKFANDWHMEGDPVYSEYKTNLIFTDIQEVLEQEIIPERKQKWGMIYAK